MVIRARRSRGRAIVVIAAVLTSLALFATVAKSAQAFEWEVGGELLSAKGVSSESTAGTGGAFTLNGKVLGSPTEITCASSTSSGSAAPGGQGSFEISLSSCSAKEKWYACTASISPIKASRELIEVEGTLYERYKPSGAATEFSRIKLGNCPIAGSYPLKGEFGAAVPQGGASVERSASFSPTVNSTIGAVLKIATEPAAMTGELNEHLSGTLSGQTWRGIRYQAGPFNWQVGGKPFVSGQVESATFSGGPIAGSFQTSGHNLKFTCSELSGKQASLKYGGITEEKLAFSGCKMSEPLGCTVAPFETVPVHSEVIAEIGGYDYSRFDMGTATEPSVYLKISGCAMSGSYPVYGSFAAKGSAHGSSLLTQPLEFSGAANKLTGSLLRIGATGVLTLSGGAGISVSSGWAWGVS